MNMIKIILIGSFLTLGSLALAGSVSGGGGGTTNPNPSTPDQVASATYGTYGHGGAIIVSWFNEQQKFFETLGEGQKFSPFYKIFKSEKSVYETLKNTYIELRMTKPCLDAEGNEVDGSIYASMKQAICISPFTMAPKLNENNVREETLALVVHEITHLFGTTEEEAVKIQQYALWNFNKIDFLDVNVKMHELSKPSIGGALQTILFDLELDSSNLGNVLPGSLDVVNEKMLRVRDELNFDNHNLLFVSPHTLNLLTPQFTRLYTVRDYVCANDPQRAADWKEVCQDNLKKVFQDDIEVTARTYVARRGVIDAANLDSTYDEVIIKNPKSPADAQEELKKLREFFKTVQLEVFQLSEEKLLPYVYQTHP